MDTFVSPSFLGQGRRLVLEVVSHEGEPRRFVLAPGDSVRVGRTAISDVVIAGDEQLSGAHFLLSWDGVTAAVCDLGSATGTLVGGAKAGAAELKHGDWIRAGNSDFRIYFEGQSSFRIQIEPNEARARARQALRSRLEGAGERLYAVLDAARSPRILELLDESVDERRSLFDGFGGAALWRVAPYLVELAPRSSGLLDRLLDEGWGRGFGIYVVSTASLAELRQHFRRHLRAVDPDGKPMYFRLYDPRVLRRFLPIATERQRLELFAGVTALIAEAGTSKPDSDGQPPSSSLPDARAFSLGPNHELKEDVWRLSPGPARANNEARGAT